MGQGSSGPVRDEQEIINMAKSSIPYTPPLDSFNPLNPRVFLDISAGGQHLGRLILELKADVVPKTAENFRQLCMKAAGAGGYKGVPIHAVKPDSVVQGGDVTNGNGKGGNSIYGRYFDDENFKLKHKGPGVLSMATNKPNTNSSQFFITLKEKPHFDGKHVAFGQILEGYAVLKAIEMIGSESGRTFLDLVISNCGDLAFAELSGEHSSYDPVIDWDGPSVRPTKIENNVRMWSECGTGSIKEGWA